MLDGDQPRTYDGEETPPPFGHAMLKYFAFEPSYTNMNHGSYGSIPLPVMTACQKITYEIEANPDRFMRITYKPLLVNVRERVAQLIGANIDECVMVPNATHGVNTVLRNFEWSEDDTIVGTSVTYPAVARVTQYLSDIKPHPKLSTFRLSFPTCRSDILDQFKAHLKALTRKTGCKIVAVIDGIVSAPGALLPWKEMVQICRDENVISVIDAAHCIGQEGDIKLNEVDPDFWISNCHKWLYAKRGCAVLYVPKRNQHLIKSSIPTSHYYVSPSDPPGDPPAPNFVGQFEWTGTCDMAPYLSVNDALDFRKWLGGEKKINDYCRELAVQGGRKLAEILGTRVMDENAEFTANMVNVELPLHVGGSLNTVTHIRERLMNERNMSTQIYYHNLRWWTRCSAQIFNDLSDFEKLGKALADICSAINKDMSRETM